MSRIVCQFSCGAASAVANIHTLPNVEKMHLFGEEMPTDDDEA